ncbi:hypothetical protein ABW19_dt0205618 [Dactylella cylindrospora]|nr:hypothetical protein ABW19_dt0205618 [Dactylella cylindrospora]
MLDAAYQLHHKFYIDNLLEKAAVDWIAKLREEIKNFPKPPPEALEKEAAEEEGELCLVSREITHDHGDHSRTPIKPGDEFSIIHRVAHSRPQRVKVQSWVISEPLRTPFYSSTHEYNWRLKENEEGSKDSSARKPRTGIREEPRKLPPGLFATLKRVEKDQGAGRESHSVRRKKLFGMVKQIEECLKRRESFGSKVKPKLEKPAEISNSQWFP